MTDEDKINDAIVRFVQTYWSADAAAGIAAMYGEDILQQTHAVYDAVMDTPVDWSTMDMNAALHVLARSLPERFPSLSEEAMTRMNYCFIMTWK